MATLSITIDEAADEIWGKKNEKSDSDSLNKARHILYMLRCAYAHGTVEPKWDIKNPKQIQLKLPDILIDFRGDSLNGQNLKLDQIGGLEGLVSLIQFIVEEASKTKT